MDARVGRAGGHPRGSRRVGLSPEAKSVHRLAKVASWSCFGPFVYTVAPLWTDVGTQECTQVGENGLSALFLAICVHCCNVRVVRAGRGDARVYTDRREWPLDTVFCHLCTLLRCELCHELRRELRRVARAPQPPWRAGGAPSVVASPLVGKPLVGKTGSARAPLLGLRLRRDSNPYKPPRCRLYSP